MACYVEDEVDWSDSPLNPVSPEHSDPHAGPSHTSAFHQTDTSDLFISETAEDNVLPVGSPLPFTFELDQHDQHVPSRAQRAQLGIHLNRRQPSKADYTNFALYQANQKVYEATFFKSFLAHALHPERLADSLAHDMDGDASLTSYLKSVLRNANGIADKMIRNAHSRTVNLLANDGKDGVPFLDVHKFNRNMFSDFCSDDPISVVGRLNESWHRASLEPAMVRMSTKQYPIGSNTSPLEEIDEIADRVFNNKNFGNLPTGRATRPCAKSKGKARALHGAARREESQVSTRGNWLAFPSFEVPLRSPTPPSAVQTHHSSVEDGELLADGVEPQVMRDLYKIQHEVEPPRQALRAHSEIFEDREASSTVLEDLFGRYGANALGSDRAESPVDNGDEDDITKVHPWRTRLIIDHKQRLTERWGNPTQTLRRVLPGIKQVIAEAFARGCRPTSNDYRRKVKIIAAREQQEGPTPLPLQATSPEAQVRKHSAKASIASPQHPADTPKITSNKQRMDVPRKKRKTCSVNSSAKTKVAKEKVTTKRPAQASGNKKKQVNKLPAPKPVVFKPIVPHPSGSTTIETDQALPPDAYFEAENPGEKPAWRCGIKHAMGYYYNAGNRTACPGCFTNIKESSKMKHMDFYLPPSSHFFQQAPDVIWTPSKPSNKVRRSKTLSHNSIAKDAYWAAINAGATTDEARQDGIEAVEAHLRPRTPKEPTPVPTPEPEPDLGPHPSGSETMEYGQDLPECAYFDQEDRDEECAWRCDVNHALGRYYLAGNKRTCPGCGSNRHGLGKQAEMDFYMPPGTVVRQEASELSKWTPRKPYKNRKSSSSERSKYKYLTHNQMCSKKYFEAMEADLQHDEAVKFAIQELDDELDAKEVEMSERQEETQRSEDNEETSGQSSDSRKNSANTSTSSDTRFKPKSRNGGTTSLLPSKRPFEDTSDEDTKDEGEGEIHDSSGDVEKEQGIISVSSSDEETSGSDSE
ncbi:hypothetical protein CC86DRAFT_319856 [Ophiobolus disseminans]|uniref:Uncharacterized protein n=1 Tax=Ophiobolus disseminans TaxID=1469910 RepID=A0A6A7A664_9PLEO|nr:hypothetical protein CC86DRAFT_319856 [Ophiobolus disseminans]